MTRIRFISIAIAAMVLGALGPAAAHAGDSNEYKLKAALIFKFLQFVDWPAGSGPGSASGPADRDAIVIATVGKDPFDGELESTVAGKSVGGKRVIVRHFPSAGEVEKCQMLFVASNGGADLTRVLNKVGPVGLLTVGESEQFLDDGGIIRIFEQDSRLRFEISQEAAARARIQISAKLLRLAKLR